MFGESWQSAHLLFAVDVIFVAIVILVLVNADQTPIAHGAAKGSLPRRMRLVLQESRTREHRN